MPDSSLSSEQESIQKISNVFIKSRLVMKDGVSRQIQSLLSMAAENAIESLINHIQSEIISTNQITNQSDDLISSQDIPVNEIHATDSVNVTKTGDVAVNQEKANDKDEEYVKAMRKQAEDIKKAIPAMADYEVIEIDEDEFLNKINSKSKSIELDELKKMSAIPSTDDLRKMWKEESMTQADYNMLQSNRNNGDNAIEYEESEGQSMEQASHHITSSNPRDLQANIVDIDADTVTLTKEDSSSQNVDTMNTSSAEDASNPEKYASKAIIDRDSENSSPPTTKFTTKSLNTWNGIIPANQKSSVITLMHSWITKWAGRGAGIEANCIPLGVNITFAVSEGYYIIELLDTIETPTKTILQSKLVVPEESNDDEVLLERVCSHLDSSLLQEINQIEITFEQTASSEKFIGIQNKSEETIMRQTIDSVIGGNYNGFNSDKEFFAYLKRYSKSSASDNIAVKDKSVFNASVDINSIPNLSVPIPDYLQSDLKDSQRLDDHFDIPRPMPQKSETATGKRKKDPFLVETAVDIGLKLEPFEGKGIEEQAIKELNNMVSNRDKVGFLQVLKSYQNITIEEKASQPMESDDNESPKDLNSLLSEGLKVSKMNWQAMLNRTGFETIEDLSQPPIKLPINLKAGGLKGGIDIFEGPPEYIPGKQLDENRQRQEEMSNRNISMLNPPDVLSFETDKQRLNLLLSELDRAPDEYHIGIIDSFRDLLLSNNLVYLLLQANSTERNYETRLLYSKISKQAVKVSTEFIELIQKESMKHLETIYDICDIARLYQDNELVFLERMDFIKPRFDTNLLAYLNYAIDEEYQNTRRRGSDPDRYPSKWLLILKLIQKGVLAEFEERYERLLEPLLAVIRMDISHPQSRLMRRIVFQRFVNITAPIDLQYMRTLALNMVENIELKRSVVNNQSYDKSGAVISDDMFTKLQDLRDDVELFLSEKFIDEKMAEYRDNAREEGIDVIVTHRNPLVRDDIELQEELARYGAIKVAGGYQGGVKPSIIDSKISSEQS